VRGAFTGATMTGAASSRWPTAARCLDEIGTLSTAAGGVSPGARVQPLGAERTQRVEVRVVAATNRDLKLMVSDGRSRRTRTTGSNA
jgi:transcriptional regulator with GAF, ATPase, and Fis domain